MSIKQLMKLLESIPKTGAINKARRQAIRNQINAMLGGG